MNLQELRDAVRAQLDVDDDDLPDSRLDLYLRDAFEATIQLEREWPFFEKLWAISFNEGQRSATLPFDVSGLITVTDDTSGHQLVQLDHGEAEKQFQLTVRDFGMPAYFSMWANELYLWPSPPTQRFVTLRGWRKPVDWLSQGASATPDCDARLEMPLIYYACSLAYAQQEDEVLEASYQNRFREMVQRARVDIMRPSSHAPKLLAGGMRIPRTRVSYNWRLNQ